jgi:hypothetical protein
MKFVKKLIFLISLPFVLVSCAHEQFETYLLDTGLQERKTPDQGLGSLEKVMEQKRTRDHSLNSLEVVSEKKETPDHSLQSFDERNNSLSYSDEFDSVKKVYSLPLPAVEILHERHISILNTAIKDLETFYLIAKYLRKYNKIEDLTLLEKYVREYMSEGIDLLLKREIANDNPEVKQTLFELQYFKALLFYEVKDIARACETLNNLESQYYQNKNVSVDFIAGRLKKKKPHMVMTDFKLLCK